MGGEHSTALCLILPLGSQGHCTPSWTGQREAWLGEDEYSAGSQVLTSARAMSTPGNSFGETVPFVGAGGVFMPLERWSGSLGQGLCGLVPLAGAEVLEDASSTYSGAVGSGGNRQTRSEA